MSKTGQTSQSISLAASKRLPIYDKDINVLQCTGSYRISDLSNWLDNLPTMQPGRVSAELYQTIPEVGRLKIKASSKLVMMEKIRPYLKNCIEAQRATLQNQPILLPDQQVKTAAVNQAIQRHANLCYATIAADLLEEGKTLFSKKQNALELSTALHRAIEGYGMQLYRSQTLYIKPPAKLWDEMNACYLIAEEQDLHSDLIHSAAGGTLSKLTIAQVFCRNMLLAAAQTEQLRQIDQHSLFAQIKDWCKEGVIEKTSHDSERCFAIDLSSNRGPTELQKLDFNDVDSIRYLDISRVLEQVRELKSSKENKLLGQHILDHLLRLWEQHPERLEKRYSADGNLEVAVGLKSAHYQIAGKKTFDDFLSQINSAARAAHFHDAPTSDQVDVWSDAFDADKESILFDKGAPLAYQSWDDLETPTTQEAAIPGMTIYQVPIQDRSTRGFALTWRDEVTKEVQTGELLITQTADQASWSAGVIRWAQQQKKFCRLGVQVIASNLQACSVKYIPVSGDEGPPMRGLIAQSPHKQQTPLIILPPSPFREGQKVRLSLLSGNSTLLLESTELCSGCISIFAYRDLGEATDKNSEDDEW